ncbi:type VI secretion system secreted protein VgrG [Variovorax boronicumulans]|uniref:type VI secretion system Vgr family protein n=1 Tax=Variovorax boronicumulans TaxID=436515 RepID=UPI0027888B5D|nr:type VI secretion system Vgr family protein [Variovorax boronicumulans]MDP9994128.1 type VI secretion system secreted protein VgrG [Variovorax boronicumulans]MDQ0001781.1 type VI secretion system secreted protein VgrG [Variovorax boronicumulans]
MQRTLSIQSPAIPVLLGEPALEPVRLSGNEGLNSLFAYELLLKTPDALNLGASGAMDFDLDSFIGREITCSIQFDGAGQFVPGVAGQSVDHIGAGVRQINALITDAEVWGEEGRHVQYKLTLRPWLHLATLTTDCRIYQNKTVIQILDELLASYDFPVDKRLIETYPTRDYQVQFNESDLEFFERLTQSWGISYFFQHSEGKHRLVLIDNMGAYRKNDSAAYQQVEYHAPGWKVDAEYVSSFVPHHHLTSGRYASREYDYMRPRADLGQSRKDPRATGQADGEVYQWHEGSAAGSHYAQPRAGSAEANDPHGEGHQLALLRMEALRTHGARARASGNLRGMVPGCSFQLTKHPRQKANTEYLLLDTRFLIEDVAQDSQIGDASPGRKQQWKVEVDFTAHPMAEPLRPVPTRPKPLTHGPQTARVVGPPGQNIWTDKWGRIKVQFPWDRIGNEDQHSSCWIRVNLHGAGNQQGSIHVPRIGQEVIVDFVGGDPDLPICTGRAYNQANEPPWALPHHSALSGYRSRELTDDGGNSSAGRSNHIAMDDTKGKIQVQIKSDHQHSQLSLGHITRIEDNAGRKDDRGQGAELRTDGHAVIRARQGMLLTTEGRANAEAHITDMGETVARLTASRDQHESLSESAQRAEAHVKGDQDEVTKALKVQNDAIKGGTGDSRAGSFPELAEPHLVLASPAGIQTSTAQSTHIASVEHNAFTSGGHTSISAARSLLVSVKEAIRLYAYEAVIKLVAAKNNIDIVALERNINILAKLDIKLSANKISIRAKEQLELGGGSSYSVYTSAGITHKTSGQWIEHAAVHAYQGPDNKPTTLPNGASELKLKPPEGQLRFALRHLPDQSPMLFAHQPYTLYKNGAQAAQGVLDGYGQVTIDKAEKGATYKVKLTNGTVHDVPVAPDRMEADSAKQAHPEHHLSNQGYRADGESTNRRKVQKERGSVDQKDSPQ